MSVYDNNKVYPTFSSAPEDPDTAQNYRLQKVGEIEKFFLEEIEEREKLAKKFRRIGNTILVADTGLIITTVITWINLDSSLCLRCCDTCWNCSY